MLLRQAPNRSISAARHPMQIEQIVCIRQGAHGFGFTAFCERRIVPAAIDTRFIYRELLKQVVRMFMPGQVPVSHDEMMEVVAFQEAALRSMEAAGNEVILRPAA